MTKNYCFGGRREIDTIDSNFRKEHNESISLQTKKKNLKQKTFIVKPICLIVLLIHEIFIKTIHAKFFSTARIKTKER